MKVIDSEKYLGMILAANTTDSIHETVKKRVGFANQSVFEIRSVVDDARAEAVGRLSVGFTIWETAVIPALLHASEVWINLSKKSLKLLDKVQLKYLRLVTGVGTGCPKPVLFYHTGTLSMFHRILKRKIMFLHHVANLPLGCLARSVYDKQCLLNLGLVREMAPFLQEFGIENIQSYSKYQFQKLIKTKIWNRNKLQLLDQSRKYKKISPEILSQEEFGVHKYFRTLTVSQSRLRFRLHARMTPRVAMCFKSDRRFMEMGYQCLGCREAGEPVSQETRDTEEHIARCIYYADLREDLDLDSDVGLVTYFQRVISKRADTEKYVEENEF